MVLNVCVKFHEDISNGFDVTEWTGICGRNGIFFNVQRAITPKVRNPDLRFLCSACCVICVKFHEKRF